MSRLQSFFKKSFCNNVSTQSWVFAFSPAVEWTYEWDHMGTKTRGRCSVIWIGRSRNGHNVQHHLNRPVSSCCSSTWTVVQTAQIPVFPFFCFHPMARVVFTGAVPKGSDLHKSNSVSMWCGPVHEGAMRKTSRAAGSTPVCCQFQWWFGRRDLVRV